MPRVVRKRGGGKLIAIRRALEPAMATPVGRPPKQNNGGNLPPLDQGKTRDKVATKMATLTQGRPGLNAQICAITQPEAAAMLAWANEIKIRAKRKAGEMLAAMDKNKGAAQKGWGANAVVTNERVSTLADAGVTKDQFANWQKIAAMPSEASRVGRGACYGS